MSAPKFPYPSDEWIGQPSNDDRNHSGCYGDPDESHVKTWQQKMRDRGWSIGVDGCYGPESEDVCRQFQAEKGLSVDGDVGPKTWDKTWSAPVTADTPSSGGGGGSATKPDTSDGSWRDKVGKWHDNHLGITESPADSNCDSRDDGIRNAQDTCANGTWLRNQPWCGVWAFMGLYYAGLTKSGTHSWMASVASIEDYAKQGKAPFRGWTTDGSQAKEGDLVVLFGRGQHVGTVRSIDSGYAYTWEGNTSSGSGGSQSNGGGSYKRSRSRNGETYGYALVKGD
jgi:hypothetical protein